MPNYRITDPDSGKVVTVSAATPEAARAAAAEKLRPAASDSNRQRLEGFLSPLAQFAEFLGAPRMPSPEQFRRATGAEAPPGLLDPARPFSKPVEGISTAGEENPTPLYTFWRGAGRGASGVATLAATGGLSLPLAGSSFAGGIVGSEVETATDSPILGAVADLATSLLTANPSGAVRLARKLRIGGGRADDAVRVVDQRFTQAMSDARSAFARVPENVAGTADATKLRDLAQRLIQINAPEDVPGVVRRMAGLPDQVDFATLRRLIGSHANAMRQPGTRSGVAGRVAGELDNLLNQFEVQQTSGGAASALRSAREGWAAFRSLFPTKGSFAHAVLNPKTARDKPLDALAYVFNAKNSTSQAKILAQAVVGDVTAEEGLKRAYLQYLAQSADQTAFRGVVTRFDDTREIATMLFGEKATRTLERNLHRASQGGGVAAHPYLLAMFSSGTAAALGGVSPKLTGVIAAGSAGWWAVKHFGAARAQKIFLSAAYDDGLRKILASRATRAEAPEVIAKLTAWAARNAPDLLEEERK